MRIVGSFRLCLIWETFTLTVPYLRLSPNCGCLMATGDKISECGSMSVKKECKILMTTDMTKLWDERVDQSSAVNITYSYLRGKKKIAT